MPAQAPTIAAALESMGYATGQFGKNHLGDLNEFLPTVQRHLRTAPVAAPRASNRRALQHEGDE
jgi:arylsulfatase A-like enzyme